MPLYGFICEDCDHDFEELVLSASQTDQVACPKCGSIHVERQLSLVAGLKSGSSGASTASSASCSTGGG